MLQDRALLKVGVGDALPVHRPVLAAVFQAPMRLRHTFAYLHLPQGTRSLRGTSRRVVSNSHPLPAATDLGESTGAAQPLLVSTGAKKALLG